MAFSRKRGRPRQPRIMHDTGTPELNYKRLFHITREPLDICFERGLLTAEQHWCGLHLRWLYTLRYGAPGVRAIDPTHLGGYEIKPDDPAWHGERETEYHEAALLLQRNKTLAAILELCVFNQRPCFLDHPPDSAAQLRRHEKLLAQIRTGLDSLARFWKRR